MTRTEIVVIGGGHNGLTCAAYLARAGREVTVLEARDELGGCAATVSAIGTRVNVCNCDHTMVLALTGRQPELSRYRTPVRGLYLTGAATFPGAGVWGASGRNAASAVLAGLAKRA